MEKASISDFKAKENQTEYASKMDSDEGTNNRKMSETVQNTEFENRYIYDLLNDKVWVNLCLAH